MGREEQAQVVVDAGLPGRQQALLHRGAAALKDVEQVGQHLDLAYVKRQRGVLHAQLA